MNKRVAIIFCLITSAVCCISFYILDEAPKFIVPKGWPKPAYDFSKNKITDAGFKLGRKLFFDPVLSRDSSTSCASCHLQFSGFTHIDHALSHGINGLKGIRNSSTIFNMAWNTSFMWDGGVNNLEVQPINPITNPLEMDNNLAALVKKLNTSSYYKSKFYAAFNDSVVTSQKLLKALSQFMLLLQSYNSKYDKVMRRENNMVFTNSETEGYQLFKKNCASCHNEPLFTNNSFQNIGLPVDPELNDFGRMRISGDAKDSLKFKVPSLRNVAFSYPYMHDGRFKTLAQVIDHYTSGIVPYKNLSKKLENKIVLTEINKKDLIAFLSTLTDKEFLYDLRFRDYKN